MMIGGIDAVMFFENMADKAEDKNRFDLAMNRIKYEAAKGIGKKLKTIKAVKSWHHDTYACGECGCGIGEAWFMYCPNCGTAILRNPYTEKVIEQKHEENHQIDIEEWLKLGG